MKFKIIFVIILLLLGQYIFNYEYPIIKFLHFNTVSIVLGCMVPVYAVTLAYFALIPKYDLEKLKTTLLQLQQSDSNLLQIKHLYENYKNEYNKIKNIDKTIMYIKNLHNFSLSALLFTSMFFMISASVIFFFQVLFLITIYLSSIYVEHCIEKTYVNLSKDYPSPSDLLDVSKNLTSIKNIDINLYENLPAYILARGTSITVKNDFSDFSFINLENKEKYSHFMLINFALPFNLKNISLEYESKNNSIKTIPLSDKKLLYDRKNPSLEILITKNNELNISPHLKLSINRTGTLQEIWPFTPISSNSSEYIGRYPITVNIHYLGKLDMSRYIVY